MIDISFQARLQRIQHLHAVRPGRDAHLVPVMAAVWPDLRPRKPGALADLLAWASWSGWWPSPSSST